MADLDYAPMISIHLAMPEFNESDDLTIIASKKWPPRISCIDLVTAPIIIDSPHEMPGAKHVLCCTYLCVSIGDGRF